MKKTKKDNTKKMTFQWLKYGKKIDLEENWLEEIDMLGVEIERWFLFF